MCYDGDMSRPLNQQENRYRDMVLHLSMPQHEASSILRQIDADEPFHERLDFIKGMASHLLQIQQGSDSQSARSQQGDKQNPVGCLRSRQARMALQ